MAKAQSLNQKLVRIGVPASYASLIVNKKRNPGLSLAIKIYRELGIKIGPIENATPAEISALERVIAKKPGSVP